MRHSMIESLESRQLLHGLPGGPGGFGSGGGGGNRGPGRPGGAELPGIHQPAQTVTLNLLSTAIQTGLQTLAANAGLNPLADDTLVHLGNIEGKSTYSVTVTDSSTGTETITTLTVDATGAAISKPAVSETTFGDLTSAGTGTYDAAIAEITAISTALNLEAPTDDTLVIVRTTTSGETVLSVKLAGAEEDSSEYRPHDTIVSVDVAGNPVGNQKLPASVIPQAILEGLATLAPAGAQAAETIRVRTVDGVTLYSATYTVDDTDTTVTVDRTGAAASLPTDSTATFADLTAAAQAEIKALAEARNVTEAITDDTEVAVHTEADGTVLYTVALDAEAHGRDGEAVTLELSITVDADGNPVVTPPPARGERPGRPDDFGPPRGFPFGPPAADDTGSTMGSDDPSDDSCDNPPTGSGDNSNGGSTGDSTSEDTSEDTVTDDAGATVTSTTTKAEAKAAKKAAKQAARESAKEAKAEARAAAKAAKAAAKLAKLASKTKVTA